MSGAYFDLPLPGYSLLEHLGAAGLGVVLLGPPSIGDPRHADGGYDLIPPTVAAIDAAVLAEVVDRTGLAARPLVGLGHSMGAMLTILAQAEHRPYDALVVLGWSGRGLPAIVDETELAYADRPDALYGPPEPPARRTTVLGELTERRFGRPIITGRNGPSDYVMGVGVDPAARAALVAAGAPLIGCCGLAAMIPGSHRPQIEQIDVPVFCGLGEHDITPEPRRVAEAFVGSNDVTLHLLPGAGHNANVAPTRAARWDRIVGWVRSLGLPARAR